MRYGWLWFALALGMATRVWAADVYAVKFTTPPYIILDAENCVRAGWTDRLLFHNVTTQDQIVQFLGVSNGPSDPSSARDLTVPSGATRSVYGGGLWGMLGNTYEWVVHLDVPTGVLVESRAELGGGPGLPCSFPQIGGDIYGALPLLVFTTLTPAGQAQIHLGTDLGTDAAHQNVGIYNAGAAPATATIGLHQGCDDALVVQRTATIPPNSIVQVEGLRPPAGSCTAANAPEFITYVVVTVDQPSFSYVTTLSDDLPPRMPVGFSYTH